MDEGHRGLPTDELVPLAEKLLGVPQQLIHIAGGPELKGGTVAPDRIGETDCVFLAGLYRAERTNGQSANCGGPIIALLKTRIPKPAKGELL